MSLDVGAVCFDESRRFYPPGRGPPTPTGRGRGRSSTPRSGSPQTRNSCDRGRSKKFTALARRSSSGLDLIFEKKSHPWPRFLQILPQPRRHGASPTPFAVPKASQTAKLALYAHVLGPGLVCSRTSPSDFSSTRQTGHVIPPPPPSTISSLSQPLPSSLSKSSSLSLSTIPGKGEVEAVDVSLPARRRAQPPSSALCSRLCPLRGCGAAGPQAGGEAAMGGGDSDACSC